MVLANSDQIPRVRSYSGSHCPFLLFRLQDFHLLWLTFPYHSSIIVNSLCGPSTPCFHGLGSFLFARRYSGNRFFFLFLQVLRWFSSLGLPPPTLFIQVRVIGYDSYRVSPFGYHQITAYLQLPDAFRRSLRPSSAPSA